jgi:hypothetical protein
VPLPPGARAAQGAAYDYVNAWLVPGSDFATVVAFYDKKMPEGQGWQGWQGWTWCDTGGDDSANPSRIYAKGSRDILNVTVTNDKPPGVLIGVDQSGPC